MVFSTVHIEDTNRIQNYLQDLDLDRELLMSDPDLTSSNFK